MKGSGDIEYEVSKWIEEATALKRQPRTPAFLRKRSELETRRKDLVGVKLTDALRIEKLSNDLKLRGTSRKQRKTRRRRQ